MTDAQAQRAMPGSAPFFEIVAVDGDARAGVLHTNRGVVETPCFMPVGTLGAVKTLSPAEVEATGARVVLGNTYHLWLRPGPEIIARLGGLHAFCRWPHAMLTDSGGFQAFSLAGQSKLTDDGFVFRSHLDGSRHHLSPEQAMRVQAMLGADIAMQLDVCPPGDAPRAQLERACRLTTAWAHRCLDAHRRLASERPLRQAVFGIVQGGTDVALRRAHAAELGAMPFAGLALGGFSVGESVAQMHEALALVAPELDRARPRYLMGVGTPSDLLRAVSSGIDMFDCVLPTRNARNGQALTRTGKLVIKNARFKDDAAVIEEGCGCPTCRGGFSRAYLRHLLLSRETLVLRLLTAHNLQLYGQLMSEARQAIIAGRYPRHQRRALESLQPRPSAATAGADGG